MDEQEREDWLKWSRGGIGGSEVAALLDLSPWLTPLSVWEAKMGIAQETAETEAMRWGIRNEKHIIDDMLECLELRDCRLENVDTKKVSGYMRGTADALIFESGFNAPAKLRCIFEAKTSRHGNGFGDDGTDDIPEHYMCQVQHYLEVFDCEQAYLGCLLAGSELRIYPIKRNRDIGRLLRDTCNKFWREHVLTKTPPPPSSYAECSRIWKRSNESYTFADSQTLDLLAQIKQGQAQIKELEKLVDGQKKQLCSFIAEAEGVQDDRRTLATWKPQTTKRLDVEALKSQMPQIYEQFLKITESRVLRIK